MYLLINNSQYGTLEYGVLDQINIYPSFQGPEDGRVVAAADYCVNTSDNILANRLEVHTII